MLREAGGSEGLGLPMWEDLHILLPGGLLAVRDQLILAVLPAVSSLWGKELCSCCLQSPPAPASVPGQAAQGLKQPGPVEGVSCPWQRGGTNYLCGAFQHKPFHSSCWRGFGGLSPVQGLHPVQGSEPQEPQEPKGAVPSARAFLGGTQRGAH